MRIEFLGDGQLSREKVDTTSSAGRLKTTRPRPQKKTDRPYKTRHMGNGYVSVFSQNQRPTPFILVPPPLPLEYKIA